MEYQEGELFREARDRCGLKQWWVSEQAGIDQHRLSDIEHGEVLPFFDEAVRLARSYGRALESFVPDDGTFEDRRAGKRKRSKIKAIEGIP